MAITTDLTHQNPRGIRNKDVAGIYGVARMADKARAAYTGKLAGYQYGNASRQDAPILAFLGVSAEDFQQAAVNNQNNESLSAWIIENCGKTLADIEEFNEKMMRLMQNQNALVAFTEHRRKLLKKRTNVTSWIGFVWRWRLWFGR